MARTRYLTSAIITVLIILTTPSGVLADAKPDVITDCDKQRADETMCLACNIYHESRGEPRLGKLGVGLVTINRVASNAYPSSICEVVWEKHKHYETKKMTPQFSWTLDGKSDKVYHQNAWDQSLDIATRLVSGGGYPDITAGALWYHADYVDPAWAAQLYLTIRIDHHLYYATDEATANKIMEANFSKVVE